MLILPTKNDSSEYYDAVIYLTKNGDFVIHTISWYRLRQSKSYKHKHGKPYKKCKQMFDDYGQFSVWDFECNNGMKIVKPSTVLYVESYLQSEHFQELNSIVRLFSSNHEFWDSRFMNFNEDNYPEYFI